MGWQKIKVGFWSAIGGAILLAIVGFSWGGWVTSGTAQEMATAAVADRLTPICVTQFNQDSDKEQKLKELTETSSWQRDRYVEKSGWATMPGEKKADGKVADACASQIMQIGQRG